MEAPVSNKQKHRKEKPWDHDGIDHQAIQPFLPEDNPGGMVDESSFVILFPKYREQYLVENWDTIERTLSSQLRVELDRKKGSMSIFTTSKTYDPFIIMKGRDMLTLLARSVPVEQSKRVLDDGVYSDIIKTAGFVFNKERYAKRRQRLLGPSGSTLKALELLTDSYIMIQGHTVAVIGNIRGLKQVRKIVEDCLQNIHPVYHIKELMIRRELERNPEMKDKSWDNALPQFKKRHQQGKRKKAVLKSRAGSALFPPEQTPRKEDLEMATGEYFLKKVKKHGFKNDKKNDKSHKDDKNEKNGHKHDKKTSSSSGKTSSGHKSNQSDQSDQPDEHKEARKKKLNKLDL